jgi:O-succinylbenzoic acid--CoA ligase
MLLDFTYQKNNKWYSDKWLPELKHRISQPWQEEIYCFLDEWFSGKETFEIKTSGTTGTPKTVEFLRNALISSAQITIDTFDLKPDDTLLMCLPTRFVAGKMMLVRAIAGEMRVLALEPKSNPINKLNETIDFAAFTPHQIQHIIQETPEKLNLIKKGIIGGSPVSDVLKKRLLSYSPAFYETYGMSETLTHLAIRPLTDQEELFTVLKDFNIDVDKEGCLVIDAAHLPNCPMVTSDLVEIVNRNKFRWLGRADDVINSAGVKFFPAVIEKKLGSIIDQNFIISKQRNDDLGEIVVLFIEGKELPDDTLKVLKKAFIEVLDKYELPKKIIFLDQFPSNINGKIIRSEIK